MNDAEMRGEDDSIPEIGDAAWRGKTAAELEETLEELSSAEDFLDYFGVVYDSRIVQINRLHIMQRFHDYLAQSETAVRNHTDSGEALAAVYKTLLTRAYQDFVESDALTEKVFKVFKMQEPQTTFVSAETLLGKS